MNYIVLDMEWNQPEDFRKRINNPVPLHGEIIQIGAVMMDDDMNEIGEFNTYIRPKFYRKLNKTVKELTNIDPADLRDGVGFEEAIRDFSNWCGREAVLFTWGPSDIDMLEANLNVNGLDESWIPENFDAQLMFDDLETMEERNFSLDYAVYYFGIKGGKAHDALNDARDTAAVIKQMDYRTWIEEEREYRAEIESEEMELELENEEL